MPDISTFQAMKDFSFFVLELLVKFLMSDPIFPLWSLVMFLFVVKIFKTLLYIPFLKRKEV